MTITEKSLQELRSTVIWKYLNSINPSYAILSEIFVANVAPLLDTISRHFPYYTNHGANHSYNILKRYEHILKSECFIQNNGFTLSDTESYLLICSAYGHDLGMTVFPGEESHLQMVLEILPIDSWETNNVLQTYLRANHSTRGYEYIAYHAEELKIPVHLLSHLNELMVAHNLPTSELKNNILKKYTADQKSLPLPQLAAVLCIADALEFSETRVKDSILTELKQLSVGDNDPQILESYQENMKHVCIHSNLTIEEQGSIVVNGTFLDADVLNLAHKTFDNIENWLRDYIEIDYSYSPRTKLRIPIHRYFEYPKADFERLGIRMKKDNVINLIASNSLWENNKGIVIKELLQNAVEACRYRQFNSSPADAYSPSIEVIFNDKEHVITVKDNGCGMSKDVILNNFLTVGNSRSTTPEYTRQGYISLARFGVGFWSVFTIAKHVEVQTLDYTTLATGLEFDVSIALLKDYILFKEITISAGTTIKLFLKDGVSINDIKFALDKEIICSEIPIRIISKDSEYSILQSVTLPTPEIIFGAKFQMAKNEDIKLFYWQEDTTNYDLKVFIMYKIVNDKPTFLLSNAQPVHRLTNYPMQGYNKSSLCGFSINVLSVYTPFQANAIVGYLANIKNPKGFIFNLNRRTILPSKELESYSEKLSEFLCAAMNQFLLENKIHKSEEIYRLYEDATKSMQGGIGFQKQHFINISNLYPHLIIFKLYKIQKGNKFNNCTIEYLSIKDLLAQNITIFGFMPFHNFSSTYSLSERNSDIVYNILADIDEFQGGYFHMKTTEIEFLFDSDSTSQIIALYKNMSLGEKIPIPIIKVNTSSIELKENHVEFIGSVQGIWSGQIIIKSIVGKNFIFAYNRIIVNPDSKIAIKIKELLLRMKMQFLLS